jgi:type I restriction enzyme S subunit
MKTTDATGLNPEMVRGWKRHPAFKDLGLPWRLEIPAHWKRKRLKRIAAVRPSNVDKKTVEGQEPVRLCNYVDVYKNDYITADLDFMAASATPAQVEQFQVRAGDVIITKDSESWDDIAVPAYVPSDLPGVVCGYHLAVVRPRPEEVNGEYLFRCFAAEGLCDQYRIAANGITRFGLDTDSLRSGVFPVPPLDEQVKIAAFLNRETAKIDALIAKKERLIELLQEKRAALISHAATKGLDSGVPMRDSRIGWIKNIPAHWQVSRTKFVARLESGHTPSRQCPEYWVNCTIPWITLSDVWQLRDGWREYVTETKECVSELGLANSAARLLPAGTVVVSRTASVGYSGIMQRPMATSQDYVNWVCSKRMQAEYLLYVFRSMGQEFRRLTMGSTHQTIYMPDVQNFTTPVPPLDEQKRIVDYIRSKTTAIRDLINRITPQIGKLREYRTALISAAVTGRIDMRHEVV